MSKKRKTTGSVKIVINGETTSQIARTTIFVDPQHPNWGRLKDGRPVVLEGDTWVYKCPEDPNIWV